MQITFMLKCGGKMIISKIENTNSMLNTMANVFIFLHANTKKIIYYIILLKSIFPQVYESFPLTRSVGVGMVKQTIYHTLVLLKIMSSYLIISGIL